MNLNVITLSGRLTGDSTLNYSANELPIANFRMAVNDRRNDDALFINVVVFGKQAEALSEYLKKGRLVGVTGRLQMDTYEKEGKKYERPQIVAQDVQLGPSREAKEAASV